MSKEKPFSLGGQALVEGVMMRSPHFVGAAVRRADGEIEVRVERFDSVLTKSPILRLPLIRGVVALVEMMMVGVRYLNWSGTVALQGNDLQGNDKPESGTSVVTASAAPEANSSNA